jgi:CRISPR-associated endonuclease Cas3-HD
MSPDRLWAKSKRPEDPETPSMLLAGHLADVLQAADALLDATGDHQLLALGLDPQRYRDRLRRCVRLASASHDLGKANNHFQDMIRGRRNVRQYPQGLRHEWVTILILEELKPWLIQAVADNETDFALVEWAIAGHHPAPDHTCPPKTCPAGAGPDITILSDHIDVHTILQWFRQSFDLAAPPALARVQHLLIGGDSAITKLAKWAKSIPRRRQGVPDCRRRGRLGASSVRLAPSPALDLDYKLLQQSPKARRHPAGRRPSPQGWHASRIPAGSSQFSLARDLRQGRLWLR